jgi:hypothetical protein
MSLPEEGMRPPHQIGGMAGVVAANRRSGLSAGRVAGGRDCRRMVHQGSDGRCEAIVRSSHPLISRHRKEVSLGQHRYDDREC